MKAPMSFSVALGGVITALLFDTGFLDRPIWPFALGMVIGWLIVEAFEALLARS